MIALKIQGHNELLNVLRKLPEGISKTLLDKAVKKGADVLVFEAKMRAPLGKTGNLILGIGRKKKKTVSPLLSVYEVGWNKPAYHGHLIEYGHYIYRRASAPEAAIGLVTGKVKTRRRGVKIATGEMVRSKNGYYWANTGKRTKPHPHLRPAFYQEQQKIIDAVKAELTVDKIEKYVIGKAKRKRKSLLK